MTWSLQYLSAGLWLSAFHGIEVTELTHHDEHLVTSSWVWKKTLYEGLRDQVWWPAASRVMLRAAGVAVVGNHCLSELRKSSVPSRSRSGGTSDLSELRSGSRQSAQPVHQSGESLDQQVVQVLDSSSAGRSGASGLRLRRDHVLSRATTSAVLEERF